MSVNKIMNSLTQLFNLNIFFCNCTILEEINKACLFTGCMDGNNFAHYVININLYDFTSYGTTAFLYISC